MEYVDETILTTISNEFDYSNIVPTVENISYIVHYCDNVYSQFMKLIEKDELKNEKLKYEFQEFNYKRGFGQGLVITILNKNYNSIRCENYDSFVNAMKSDKINDISSLVIQLDLEYKKGNNSKMDNYENTFKLSFRPYEIMFTRNSNHNETNMNIIENNINEMLKKFLTVNTIFCTKK